MFNQAIKTGLALSAFVISMGMLAMACLDTGLARQDAYPAKVAFNEAAEEFDFGVCVEDVQGFYNLKRASNLPMDKCPDVMAGKAVL